MLTHTQSTSIESNENGCSNKINETTHKDRFDLDLMELKTLKKCATF